MEDLALVGLGALALYALTRGNAPDTLGDATNGGGAEAAILDTRAPLPPPAGTGAAWWSTAPNATQTGPTLQYSSADSGANPFSPYHPATVTDLHGYAASVPAPTRSTTTGGILSSLDQATHGPAGGRDSLGPHVPSITPQAAATTYANPNAARILTPAAQGYDRADHAPQRAPVATITRDQFHETPAPRTVRDILGPAPHPLGINLGWIHL